VVALNWNPLFWQFCQYFEVPECNQLIFADKMSQRISNASPKG